MTQLALPVFAPSRPNRYPAEPIARTAIVDGHYRYLLRRKWGSGACILWAMLNPSTANHLRDDPTLWNIIARSFALGFGELAVVNIYPRISAAPSVMKRWRATIESDRDAHQAWIRNFYEAEEAVAAADLHVAAWGNNAEPEDVQTFVDQMRGGATPANRGREIAWHCLGTTHSGAPKHPLARGKHLVPVDFKPVPWRSA